METKENNNEYLDLFFNCAEHSSKRECLDGIFTRLKQDERGQFKEDLQGIIDFVNGTDRDVEEYVKELKEGI
jgi:hypothetical protein